MVNKRNRKYIRNRKVSESVKTKKNLKEFLACILTYIVPLVYAISCLRKYHILNYYGISQDLFYVDMNESIPYIIKHIFISIFIIFLPYLNYKYPAKGVDGKIALFIVITFTVAFTYTRIQPSYFEFINSIFPVICLIGSISIYNLKLIKKSIFNKKPLETLIKKIMNLARILFLYLLLFCSALLPLSWAIDLFADATGLGISQKQHYQVLENGKVVVATYKDSFVVFEYEHNNNTTYIYKNDYELIPTTGVKLKPVKFKNVNIVEK